MVKMRDKNIAFGRCRLSGKCGGCEYNGTYYEKQLKQKQTYLEKLLGTFGKVEPVIGMEDPFYYRNKVHHALKKDRSGNIISGPYEKGTHWVLQSDECLIEDKKSQEIIHFIRKLIKSFHIKIYDEDTGYGCLRHILIRRGFQSGETMVVLVIGNDSLPSANHFTKALVKQYPEIKTVVLNYNGRKTSMILGEREKVLYGPGFIKDELCGKTFRISSSSFYQVNPVQTEVLYNTAISFAYLRGNETIIDAYCGIGTIGLAASGRAGNVIGIELNKNAVRDARRNTKENEVKNAHFFAGDAGEFMQKMAARGEKADVVFMDPPRAGSNKRFMDCLIRIKVPKIVYVSCGPESLARDLRYLTGNGYRVEKIQPVDMFPWTGHVETVCLLSKLSGAKNSIDVKVDMDELDVTSAETKATYEEIKVYVLEQTGLQVSNLYIAQVKRECGIIERENYNKPKSEESRQPQCPEEKKTAIVEALKHYHMI